MEDFNLLAPLLLAIVGLLAGAILKSILKRTVFPYTVGLFVFGLLNLRFLVRQAYLFKSVRMI